MKALAAVEETEDDRRARRLVFARMQVADLTATIVALEKQKASFAVMAVKHAMPDDHSALVACEGRRDAELARLASERGGAS